MKKALEELGCSGAPFKATKPWNYRKRGSDTWIKRGEFAARQIDFSVQWDTTAIKHGGYEILGSMHVFVKKGDEGFVVAGRNRVHVTIENCVGTSG